jgi:hypothetical protein
MGVFFFVFLGEMKQGKGSLGLGWRLKHSLTPFSLILLLISFISLIFAKRVLTLGFLLVLEEIEGRLKSLEGILKAPIGRFESLEERLNSEGYHL